MRTWLTAMVYGGRDTAAATTQPAGGGTPTPVTDADIVVLEQRCATAVLSNNSGGSPLMSVVPHGVLADTQPLVQWIVLVSPPGNLPTAPQADASSLSAERGLQVVGAQHQKRPKPTPHSLTVTQLRSILKFIGVKPQNASMASNLVLNTLVLDALVLMPHVRTLHQQHQQGTTSLSSPPSPAAASTQRGRRGGQLLEDDAGVTKSQTVCATVPPPEVLRLMLSNDNRGVATPPPSATSPCSDEPAEQQHRDASQPPPPPPPPPEASALRIPSMHTLLQAVERSEQTRRHPSDQHSPQPELSFFVEVSTAYFIRVVHTILVEEKHITSMQPPILRQLSSPSPLTQSCAPVSDAASAPISATLHGAPLSTSTSSALSPHHSSVAASRRQSLQTSSDPRCISFCIRMQQRLQPLVVLVGGTSGCGKSTLAHLLANRLGIATVISTDGIRELLRSRRDPETCPELFASTYEAHLRASKSDAPDHVDSSAAGGDQPEGADDKLGADDDQQQPACPEGEAADRIYSSFERQATHVLTVLDRVLRAHVCRGDSVLVEGVHLLPAYAASLTASLTARGVLCIPMIVHIVNAEKHLLRFAIRSKSMTLKPQENKYVSHFASIRCIQKRLVDTAKHLGGSMLLVNNTNVDKSLSTIHFHVLRMVDRMMVVQQQQQQQSTSTTSSSVVGSPTNWATASSLAMLAPSPVSDGAVVGIMHHPPAATGSAPTTTVAPLHDVKGKHVVTLLMRRRAEKRQRRARSAEVVIGGGAAPSNASGSTPPQCISPVHGAQSAGCCALDVVGATTAASDTPTTLAPPQQGGGRPPLHAAVKHHGLSPPLGPTGATGTSPSSLSAQRSLSADASDPRRRYGGSFSTACNSRTTMPAVSESEDEVDGHGCGSGSDVASGDESQGADAGEDPCVNRSGGRSPGAQGVAMMQPRRRNDGTFARMHKRNTSSGADDDDEAPSLVGS